MPTEMKAHDPPRLEDAVAVWRTLQSMTREQAIRTLASSLVLLDVADEVYERVVRVRPT